jgi:hypothetical protein
MTPEHPYQTDYSSRETEGSSEPGDCLQDIHAEIMAHDLHSQLPFHDTSDLFAFLVAYQQTDVESEEIVLQFIHPFFQAPDIRLPVEPGHVNHLPNQLFASFALIQQEFGPQPSTY